MRIRSYTVRAIFRKLRWVLLMSMILATYLVWSAKYQRQHALTPAEEETGKAESGLPVAPVIPGRRPEAPEVHEVPAGRPEVPEVPGRLLVQSERTVPLILWWDPIPVQRDETISCGHNTCDVTANRDRLHDNDVMMVSFYGPGLSVHSLPVPRRATDLWALFHDESPKNREFLFSHAATMELFNYTASFQRTSHFSFPTQWLGAVEDLVNRDFVVSAAEKSRLQREEQLATVLYVQSDCVTPSDRDHYVELLQRHVTVDSYGPCLNNKKFPDSLSFKAKGSMSPMISEEFYRFVARYKFVVAIENAACPDYVTEKFWRSIHLGVVPIVFGAPNVKDYLPSDNSALLVEDFESVERLAAAVQRYDADDTLYAALLAYKDNGVVTNPALLKLLEERPHLTHARSNAVKDYTCFLCDKLHTAINQHRQGEPIPASVSDTRHYSCEKPGKFDEQGKYVRGLPQGKFWDIPWRYSQAQACLMRRMLAENKQTSEKEFEDMTKQTMKNFESECL